MEQTAIMDPVRDNELAKIVVGAALSNMFLARGSFPPGCFRTWTWEELTSPDSTHASIVSSEESNDDDQSDPPYDRPVYIRRTQNRRANAFLDLLVCFTHVPRPSIVGTDRVQEKDIFRLLEHGKLGKILVCFLKSKQLQDGALLEYYSLKFSYTASEEVSIYIDWAGGKPSRVDETEGDFERLQRFMMDRPPLIGEPTITYESILPLTILRNRLHDNLSVLLGKTRSPQQGLVS